MRVLGGLICQHGLYSSFFIRGLFLSSCCKPVTLVALLVVFIDVIGFGLILPIFNTILQDPQQTLSLFSGSVGPSEQGWVMGVTVAIYALGSGTITALSGSLMTINLRMPFLIAIICCVLALIAMAKLFRHPGVQSLDTKGK